MKMNLHVIYCTLLVATGLGQLAASEICYGKNSNGILGPLSCSNGCCENGCCIVNPFNIWYIFLFVLLGIVFFLIICMIVYFYLLKRNYVKRLAAARRLADSEIAGNTVIGVSSFNNELSVVNNDYGKTVWQEISLSTLPTYGEAAVMKKENETLPDYDRIVAQSKLDKI